MTERERSICSRVREIREQIKWSQADFAKELGITRPKLVSIEYGHTPLRYDLALTISRTFDIQAKWLATGEGSMRPFVPLFWFSGKAKGFNGSELLSAIFDLAPVVFEPLPSKKPPVFKIGEGLDFKAIIAKNVEDHCANVRFHNQNAAWDFNLKMCDFLDSSLKEYIAEGVATRILSDQATSIFHYTAKKDLTLWSTSANIADVKNLWPSLKRRLQLATKPNGKKSQLAKMLQVDLSVVSRWLSDKDSTREPGAEYTLRLLHWVERQERQK